MTPWLLVAFSWAVTAAATGWSMWELQRERRRHDSTRRLLVDSIRAHAESDAQLSSTRHALDAVSKVHDEALTACRSDLPRILADLPPGDGARVAAEHLGRVFARGRERALRAAGALPDDPAAATASDRGSGGR